MVRLQTISTSAAAIAASSAATAPPPGAGADEASPSKKPPIDSSRIRPSLTDPEPGSPSLGAGRGSEAPSHPSPSRLPERNRLRPLPERQPPQVGQLGGALDDGREMVAGQGAGLGGGGAVVVGEQELGLA